MSAADMAPAGHLPGPDTTVPLGPEPTHTAPFLPSTLLRLSRAWQWLQTTSLRGVMQARPRRLRVRETVSLGEKRVLAIVAVDGTEYLIGGGNASLALLTPLPPQNTSAFQDLLDRAGQGEPRA